MPLGVAADTGVDAETGADVDGVGAGAGAVDGPATGGGALATDGLRLGTGFGFGFVFGDFGVDGELRWEGVEALAAGVEAAAGDATFSGPACFFFAAASTGVG